MAQRSKLDALAADRNVAAGELARYLAKGQLALFLGAGASHGFGLPPWHELVVRCLAKAGMPSSGIDATTEVGVLMRKAELVERKCGSHEAFTKLVSTCLYQAAHNKSYLDAPPLVRALGALLMGSIRGHVSEVLTLNFDSLLEGYLRFHGFMAQTITEVPSLEADVDVRIYHPNGYLPNTPDLGKPSSFLLFSQLEFERRIGDRDNLWKDVLRQILLSKVVLMIGLSNRDTTLSAEIASAALALKDDERPVAFWMLGPTSDEDEKTALKERGCVPLCLDSFADYPEFLLQVCRKAANIADAR